MGSWNPGSSARLWSQSKARNAIMGIERTNNPTPSAASLLGKGKVARARAVLKRRGKKRAHKGNPLPAVVALLGSGALKSAATAALTKLGIGSKYTKDSHVARFAAALASGNTAVATALLGQAAAHASANIPDAAEWKGRLIAMQQLGNAKVGSKASPSGFDQLSALMNPALIGSVVRATTKRSRSTRSRYPSYVGRDGRPRYSYKPPGSQMQLPVGAVAAAGSPYSFFQGAVGKGGVGTTAAQLGVAAAAGAAAYFGTQAILKYFGGRVVAKEEAGVQLALAARDARKEYALTHGLRGAAPSYGVPAAVIREIGAGMKEKLAELGYNAQGVRTRSGVENFLSDYNPFD